jgi:hypothetical protein
MSRLGHAVIREQRDNIVYEDRDTGSYMTIVFEKGEILEDYLADNLRYEGINPDVFFSELESM